MKSVLVRTGSVPGSPKISLSVQDSIAGVVFSSDKATISPPKKMSLHLQNNGGKRNVHVPGRSIRRAFSESNVIQAENDVSRRHSALTSAGSRSFTARIPEEEHFSVGTVDVAANYAGNWPGSGISVEELGFNGGGIGKGKITGGGGGGGGGGDISTGGYEDQRKIGAYYQEMLKSNPGDSLLLRNYGKFLHEVEGDTVRAEEYYGRAILASPGDGEVLSLYGKLIWETQRDETRAKSYFDQALFASPTDCMVLGSYARFMWEAEEDEDEEEMIKREAEIPPAAMVADLPLSSRHGKMGQ